MYYCLLLIKINIRLSSITRLLFLDLSGVKVNVGECNSLINP